MYMYIPYANIYMSCYIYIYNIYVICLYIVCIGHNILCIIFAYYICVYNEKHSIYSIVYDICMFHICVYGCIYVRVYVPEQNLQ